MSRAGILLRLWLSLMLVLNGAGSAWAGATMLGAATSAETSAAKTAMVPSAQAHEGCHGHAADAPANASPAEAPDPVGHSDCCGPGPCACACAQLPGLATVELDFVPPLLAHAPWSASRAHAWPAPALRHPIRPPIVQA